MKVNHYSDTEIWKRFVGGDDKAFYLLYDRYADMLYAFGVSITCEPEFVKDSIHDLFLDLYKYRKKLALTDNVKFYLLGSIKRKLAKKQLYAARFIKDGDMNLPELSPDKNYEESLIASETEKIIRLKLVRAMNGLTYRQRAGLSLKFEHNLTYDEIATVLGISVESARTIVYRALKTLRKSV